MSPGSSLGNAAFLAIVLAVAWLVSLLDPEHRATRDARREEARQRRYDRQARQQAGQAHAETARRHWASIGRLRDAGHRDIADDMATRARFRGIEDPRR